MTHADEIATIRRAQAEASRSGATLTYQEAKAQVRAGPQVDARDAKITALQADLKALQSELASIRVTGPGHSGTGPRGMMFKSSTADAGGSGAGTTGTFNMIAAVYDSGGGSVTSNIVTSNGAVGPVFTG